MQTRQQKPDIYHFERKMRSACSCLEKSSIDQRGKELIGSFIEHLKSRNVGIARLSKYIYILKVVGENLGVPFENVTRKDIEHFMTWLYDQGYSPQTISDYTVFVKRFYKYVRSGNVDTETPFPEEVRWLKKSVKLSEMKQPRFLTAAEVKGMMQASKSPRDRAMLAVGFEAGLRAGELLGLNIGDVVLDERGARIRIWGKTGERTVRLISSSPLLAHYLETHPLRKQPEAPLWLTDARSLRDTRLSWVRWNNIIKDLAREAGVTGRIHNHLLRHGSATLNARHLTDAEMRVLYGWTMDSKMPSVYIHLNGGDLDDKLVKIHSGQLVVPAKPEFSLVVCPKCSENNSPGVKYCGRCGTPLEESELARASVEDEKVKLELEAIKKMIVEKLSSQPFQGRQESS